MKLEAYFNCTFECGMLLNAHNMHIIHFGDNFHETLILQISRKFVKVEPPVFYHNRKKKSGLGSFCHLHLTQTDPLLHVSDGQSER